MKTSNESRGVVKLIGLKLGYLVVNIKSTEMIKYGLYLQYRSA